MTTFLELTGADLRGASVQWMDYITGTLGYDYNLQAEVGVRNNGGRIWLTGHDQFQKNEAYGREVGKCSMIEDFNLDEDWDAVTGRIWERLKKCMPRDERELRHSMQALGGALEHSASYKSAVGVMLAERIKTVRDEATAFLVEYRKPVVA